MTSSPKIVWLLTSSRYYWHGALGELAKLFPHLTVFAPNWPGYARGFEQSFVVEAFQKPKIIPLKASATGYGLNFTYLPPGMIRRLCRIQPDLVFSNSFGIWTLLALLFKPWGGWKVVIAYEGSSPYVDYCHSPLRLAVRRWMVQVADACITNSQAGKNYLTTVLHASSDQVFAHPYQTVAPTSLLETPSTTDAFPADIARPAFLFVGRIVPRKGVRQLLEACVLLEQQGYQDYSLLIIGEGEQQEELESFVATRGLSNRVTWLGSVPYANLGFYFNQADVFVLPTFEDTWGMVVLEAMTFGKPVLCSRRAGAAELVLDGKNGYCFDPENPADLASKMQQFISDSQKVVTMGCHSKQQIQRCSPEAAAGFWAEVASLVLKIPHSSHHLKCLN